MKLILHAPRRTEAKLDPDLPGEVTIYPRFYRRQGFVPLLYFTAVDAKGNEEYYMLSVNGHGMQVKVEHLKEVLPACDDARPPTKPKPAVSAQATSAKDDQT